MDDGADIGFIDAHSRRPEGGNFFITEKFDTYGLLSLFGPHTILEALHCLILCHYKPWYEILQY